MLSYDALKSRSRTEKGLRAMLIALLLGNYSIFFLFQCFKIMQIYSKKEEEEKNRQFGSHLT